MDVSYSKSDRYQRVVVRILLGIQDVNLAKIKTGMPRHYKKCQKEQPFENRKNYLQAEVASKEQKRGLWAEPVSIPPCYFRKLKK